MGSPACRKVGGAIQKADLFGVPVSLTHEGKYKYKTTCGGTISLCLGLAFFCGFWIRLLAVYEDPDYLSYEPRYNFDMQTSFLQVDVGNTMAMTIED